MTMDERLQLLDSDQSLVSATAGILGESLIQPLKDIFGRPGKSLRSKLVRAGFYLARAENCKNPMSDSDAETCQSLADVLEAIHAGSLIVDDIQDGSRERRGRPSLHEIYGTPLAINAGNFLYFKPFEWIRNLNLSEKTELEIYRLCHSAMLNAHIGQAIDIGTRIDQVQRSQVNDVSLESLSLKTGSLTALAISVGAVIGKADTKRLAVLKDFGVRFGVALQMFDDIGNPLLPKNHPKRFEDLKLRRPSWLWATASKISNSDEDYRNFVKAVEKLTDSEEPLHDWLRAHSFIENAKELANQYLNSAMLDLGQELGSRGVDWSMEYRSGLSIINDVTERIRSSYG